MNQKSYILDFRQIKSRDSLAHHLAINDKHLQLLCNQECKKFFIKTHIIEKKNKRRLEEPRIVYEITDYFKSYYKIFANRFGAFLEHHIHKGNFQNSFGCTKGANHGTKGNAKVHMGNKILLRTDIEKFYDSISANMIFNKFIELGINEEISLDITQYITFENKLPSGFCSSPIIANMIMNDIDIALSDLASNYQAKYSRYIDDIAFSSNCKLPTISEIQTILDTKNLKLNQSKTRTVKRGQSLFVTGVNISETDIVTVPRKKKDLLRQIFYFSEKFGLQNHYENQNHKKCSFRKYISYVDGLVNYVNNIEEHQNNFYINKWREILRENLSEPLFHEKIEKRKGLQFTHLIDESVQKIQGNYYLAICVVRTEDQSIIEEVTKKTLEEYLADPYNSGNREELEKKKLHYVDATEDLRKNYIDELAKLNFECFISFQKIENANYSKEKYIEILKKLLLPRLFYCDGATADFIFEENSKISLKSLEECIDDIILTMGDKTGRTPANKSITIGSKSQFYSFSVPDFLMGILFQFIKSDLSDSPTPRREEFYEKLKDKYCDLHDLNYDAHFNRKNPFAPRILSIGMPRLNEKK